MAKSDRLRAAKKLLKFVDTQNADSRNDYYGTNIQVIDKKLWLVKPSNYVLVQLSGLKDTNKQHKMLTGFINNLLRDLEIESKIKLRFDVQKIVEQIPSSDDEPQFEEEMDFDVVNEDFEEITNFQSESIDIEILEEIQVPAPNVVFIPPINPMRRRVYANEVRIKVNDELLTKVKHLMSDEVFDTIEKDLLSVWASIIVVKSRMTEVLSFEVDDGESTTMAGFFYDTELGIINHLNFNYIMAFSLPDTVIPPMLPRLLYEGCSDRIAGMKPLHTHNKLTAVFDKHKVSFVRNTHSHLDGMSCVTLLCKYFVENLTEVSNTIFPYRNPNKVRHKRPENESPALDEALKRLKMIDKNKELVHKTYKKIIVDDKYLFEDLISEMTPRFSVRDFNNDLLAVLTEALNDYIECCDKYSYVSYFQSLDSQKKNAAKKA